MGTALLEELVYDSDGQFKSPSFWEYLVPSATEVPPMKLGHVEVPSQYTEFGIKGGGEGGRMATPAVISAAIDDALREYGMRVRNLPLRPSDIVATVQAARQGQQVD